MLSVSKQLIGIYYQLGAVLSIRDAAKNKANTPILSKQVSSGEITCLSYLLDELFLILQDKQNSKTMVIP